MENFNFAASLLFDPLSLFFLFVIFLISLPAAVYSIGYLKGEGSNLTIKIAWYLMIIFFISMAFVVTVRDVFSFLLAWEIMSLVSYFLVVFDGKHDKATQAGMIYIVMTHIGTAFLVFAFLIMYQYAHSFDFFAIKAACATMPPQVKNIVFLLLLAGFGTKAGIVPLHIWLPYAHPQAPSHISCIMSGVMIKTAIYGLIRFIIFILGVNSLWWGTLVLILSVLSCLVGIIYALMERDFKRMLAFSSVENVGVILLGIGLCMFFLSMNIPWLAVFSLAAGLYHLINHAIFKGLLFLGAGAVYKSTGTKNMEKLGGLIKKLPQTAACFFIGCLGISALPPLNGFVSEWLLLQAFFMGAFNIKSGASLFLGACAGMLALTGGLAAACFVKAFGIIFLARPRSRYAQEAKEVALSMKIAMSFLALCTIIFGLSASFIINILTGISGVSTGIDTSSMSFSLNNFILSPQADKGIYLSIPLLALVLIILGLTAKAIYKLSGQEKTVTYNTWDCGYYKLEPRNEYTSTAFSKPFRIAFSFFLLPYRKTEKIRESFYYVKSFVYETHTTQVFKKYIYGPILSILLKSAKSMRRIQPGSIHLYLFYIFAAIFLLIVFMQKF